MFDFDGVIVDSAGIKVDAYLQLFASESDSVRNAIRESTRVNGGVSRFDAFHRIYTETLKRPLSGEMLHDLCEMYSSIVVEKVKSAPFMPGALELLLSIHSTTDCYIISGTPQEEIREIARDRGIDGMFKKILGSPAPKSQITADIVTRCGYSKREIIFIGDSITDYSAASTAGIAFLGVVPANDPHRFPVDVETTGNLLEYRYCFV